MHWRRLRLVRVTIRTADLYPVLRAWVTAWVTWPGGDRQVPRPSKGIDWEYNYLFPNNTKIQDKFY